METESSVPLHMGTFCTQVRCLVGRYVYYTTSMYSDPPISVTSIGNIIFFVLPVRRTVPRYPERDTHLQYPPDPGWLEWSFRCVGRARVLRGISY